MLRLTARVFPPQAILPIDLLVKSGVQWGVCEKGSVESRKMASDYLSAGQAVQKEQLGGKGRGWAEVRFCPLSKPHRRASGSADRSVRLPRFCLWLSPTALCIASS